MSTAPTVIPKAEQPERELLGAIILSPSAMLPRCSQVTPEHFFNLQHRSIFSAIRSLESDAEPIEALSICRRIEQSGQIADFALVS
ncbi:MAG: DnaB-like helicase terminal domain [Verrucomicrobiales bacterium]|nr:DnaB-like helicase terminal domain [Verrucomicrobiales bacterium]